MPAQLFDCGRQNLTDSGFTDLENGANFLEVHFLNIVEGHYGLFSFWQGFYRSRQSFH